MYILKGQELLLSKGWPLDWSPGSRVRKERTNISCAGFGFTMRPLKYQSPKLLCINIVYRFAFRVYFRTLNVLQSQQ